MKKQMETNKILVIEDDDDHIYAVQYLLNKEKLNVIIAKDGKTGLRILEERKDIGVVIIDLVMQDISGIEILKEIKEYRPPLRRIVLTAYDRKLSVEDAEKLKVFAFLTKPIEKHSLLFTVKKALNDLENE